MCSQGDSPNIVTTMKTTKVILTSAIIAGSAALTAFSGFAQPSSLSITNLIVGSTNALWDLSQLTNELQTIEMDIHNLSHGGSDEVSLRYAAPYMQNGRGKLAGAGATTVSLAVSDHQGGQTNAPDFVGTYTSKGSISSAKGIARLAFSSRVIGTATLEGAERAVAAAATYTVKLDANTGQVSGRSVERASARGLGSISESRALSDPLPEDLGDGTWALVLNFNAATNANKLTGTASVTLQTGQEYPFTFTGNYAPRTGQSKLNLKGTDAGLGCILQVTLNTNNAFTRIVGRVSGQTVNLKQ